jgi:tetratricopeptide (TPR) repeat protein
VSSSLARKDLATDQRRGAGLDFFETEDWLVPVVLQAGDDLTIPAARGASAAFSDNAEQDFMFSSALPPAPDLGFVGADDALLAIDRAFDRNSVVLIYGFAGAGKTASAVGFARWYSITRGFSGPSIFTSFEEKRNLEQILSALEPIMVRRAGPRWPEMKLSERAELGARLLSGESILWIWDNVETLKDLSDAERNAVIAFLKGAASAGVRFLLTSRGPETGTFGYLPARIELPPLRLSESVEFAQRMLDRIGRRSVGVAPLWPILDYCQGNPLTLSIALATFFSRSATPTPLHVSRFVQDLHSGEADLEDDPTLGRGRSLTASLHSGFEALNNQARRRLALLYLFRTYVNVNVLFGMCASIGDDVIADDKYDKSWTLSEFLGDSPSTFDQVLRRASEVGLLRRPAAQHYWLHPAIQLHLKVYFRRVFPAQHGFERAARAFAESLALFAIGFTTAYGHGNQDKVIKALGDEEGNLRHAFTLSRKFGWPQAEIGLLHGIFALYWYTGRRVEWAAILDDILPDFVDAQGSALPGRERWWTFITDQRIRLAMWRRDLPKAELLAKSVLRVEREVTESFTVELNAPIPETQRKKIQSLGIALARLADILRERGDSECLVVNQQALANYELIDDRLGVSIRLFNMGHIFKNLESLRDLDKAEYYYSQSYASYPEHDTVSRAQCLAQLGSVALQRFKDELGGAKRPDLLTDYVEIALERYEEALVMTRQDNVVDLAGIHNHIGIVYQYLPDGAERALEHFRLAVRYFELSHEIYEAASTRNNAARVLKRLGRFDEALAFAIEALAVFEDIDPASEVTDHIRTLVAELQHEAGGPNA